MKKFMIIFTVVLLLCSIFTMTACEGNNEYVEGEFVVSIKSEYKNAFYEENFTVEDFKYEYIESIRYDVWYSNEQEEVGYIYVQLKEKYVEYINEVMQSVKQLDFVQNVERVPIIQVPEN